MKSRIIEKWYSLSWFSPELLGQYLWANKLFLYLIPAIPLIFILRRLLSIRFKKKLELGFTPGQFISTPYSYFRFIPAFLFAASTCLVLVALARPQMLIVNSENYANAIDIVLAIDISESMDLQDLPPNRLYASRQVAEEFIDTRTFDKIGLVIFAGKALSLSPLTYDHQALKHWLKELKTGLIEVQGSAIGNAIATSVNRLRESESKTKIIILLSDGENTAGLIPPSTAASLAASFNIKIYSIAIGKEGKVKVWDKTTGKSDEVESHLDEKTLREVAAITNGKFFRAQNLKNLKMVFKEIDQLEKSQIKIHSTTETEDYYQIYLAWGLLFFLGWLFTKNTFLTNGLED